MLCIDLLMMLVQCGGAACAGLGVRGRESDAAIVLSWATGLRLGGTSVRTPPASKTAWSARVLGRRAARASGSESTQVVYDVLRVDIAARDVAGELFVGEGDDVDAARVARRVERALAPQRARMTATDAVRSRAAGGR